MKMVKSGQKVARMGRGYLQNLGYFAESVTRCVTDSQWKPTRCKCWDPKWKCWYLSGSKAEITPISSSTSVED